MKNELSEVATKEGQPFQLFFHIGAGKTGTSSIQTTLRSEQEQLKQQGFWYLGMMLEHAPIKKYSWQRVRGIEEFSKLEPQQATCEALDVLHETIMAMKSANCSRLIWSNEAFFGRCRSTMLEVLRELAAAGVDVRIIAYVRRHDAWIRSAYVQWGLKHKTYLGRIQSFTEWKETKPNLPFFFNKLKPWLEAFGESVIVRNLDAAGDAVEDFMGVAGINQDSFERVRSNETPSGEELFFRTLFNDQFKGKVLVREFDKVMGKKSLNFDLPAGEFFNQLMPSEDMLHDISSGQSDDRRALDELLVASGQPPIDTSPLELKPIEVDPDKVLTTVCQLAIAQETKINALEEKLDELITLKMQERGGSIRPQAASDKISNINDETREQPVFVISTGRSGSTLLQRVMNCHQDLVIWGEHFGFLNGLDDAYRQMDDPEQKLFPKQVSDNTGPDLLLPSLQDPAAQLEWLNPWSFAEFREQLKSFIEGYFSARLQPGQRWGFKEIRYNSLPILRMLKKLYPQGRFVFIRRDPIEVTRSKVFANVKEDKWSQIGEVERETHIRQMLEDVRQHYQVYDKFMAHNQGICLVVDYEDLVAQPKEVTMRLLNHLNLDSERYDWDLAGKVMGNIITKTKRDDALIDLILKVSREMSVD